MTRISMLLLMLAVSGCVYVPPAWDAGDEIYLLDFIEPGVTTKDEVLAQLGQPDLSYQGRDGTNIVYRGHKSEGFLVVFSTHGYVGEIDPEEWIVTVVFNENDVVSRFRVHSWNSSEYYAGDVTAGDVIESKRRANFQKQLTLACEGNAPAQYLVAQYYGMGEGVAPNRVQAFKWYSLAEHEWPEAIQYFKDKLRQEMTLSEIAEAERLVAEWQPNQAGCDASPVRTAN